MIERWFRSLKTEMIYINEFRTPRELRGAIREYIHNYNTIRPHQALEYATPDEMYNSSFATEPADLREASYLIPVTGRRESIWACASFPPVLQ